VTRVQVGKIAPRSRDHRPNRRRAAAVSSSTSTRNNCPSASAERVKRSPRSSPKVSCQRPKRPELVAERLELVDLGHDARCVVRSARGGIAILPARLVPRCTILPSGRHPLGFGGGEDGIVVLGPQAGPRPVTRWCARSLRRRRPTRPSCLCSPAIDDPATDDLTSGVRVQAGCRPGCRTKGGTKSRIYRVLAQS